MALSIKRQGAKKKRKGGEGPSAGAAKRDALAAYLLSLRVTKCAPLPPEEERLLARSYQATRDPAIMQRLARAHVRLVVKIARECARSPDHMAELIQEGNLGLLKAIEKYDPDRGTKLASYAGWWIRAFLMRHQVDNASLIRMGKTKDQRTIFWRLGKETERLERAGVEPTVEALAAAMKVSPRAVATMQARFAGHVFSLDLPANDGGEPRSIGDYLAAAPSSRPDVAVEERHSASEAIEVVRAFAATLEGRDGEIFRDRLVSDEPMTLLELGDRYGLSRERIRQIEGILMQKLRAFVERRERGADSADPPARVRTIRA